MGQGILGNMRVCTRPSLFETIVGLQLASTGAMECQDPKINTYDIRKSKGINTGYTGILKSWIGIRYVLFGKYGFFWSGA